MTKSLAIAIAFALGADTVAYSGVGAAAIQIELSTNKQRYRLGEDPSFIVKFTNSSGQPLRVFPDPEQYDIRTLSMVGLTKHGQPKPLQFAELSTYFDSWAKDIRTILPHQTSTWVIRAQFRDRLPADWNDSTPGFYLIFYGGTAYSLPSTGKYCVAANYSFDRSHPVFEYLPSAGAPVWFGTLKAVPIVIDFER